MNILKSIWGRVWKNLFNTNFFIAVIAIFAIIAAHNIGVAQNKINEKIGDVQDTVELVANYTNIEVGKNTSGQAIFQPYIDIQNVGTRIIYLDKYDFNGSIYDINGQVLASTYSQTDSFYRIMLPTNEDEYVSVFLEFTDTDNRKWRSKIIANKINGYWDVKTFKREEIK